MVSESSEWNSEKFLMHDLLNDLAQIASSNLCIRWRYTAVVTRNNLWLSKVLEQEMIPQQLGVLADILDIIDLFP
ncbi:hypothetical protein MTR67_048788 [Solanum verrucosum]|uniref:Uncharacterized protein n=1 Tax=Solanum verrucosum TaxID=315347 RepID=A0AAF0UYM5_SOLVR|nr:hypothetical protein MTR67_048788 [Solanum verrucosum]